MGYFYKLFIAVDQLINTIFCGWPDETLSSVSYRLHIKGIRSWQMHLIDILLFWDREKDADTGIVKKHCQLSYESEKKLKQFPPEFRSD